MSGANQQPHYASASLYVGDLDPEVNEMVLYEVFSAIGPVASIRVCRETGTRRSLGYAYVNYQAISDAERSLDTLNYTPIKGVPCRIMWSHRDPAIRRSGAGNIFVKNLDKIIDNKALHDTFSLFGNILSCKVATDEYGKSKGYGFIHYETDESARTAIEKVNNMQIGSKSVYVGPFKKQLERPDSRSSHFTNVYIKQFPDEWTEDTVRNAFAPFGEITSLVLAADPKKCRRFALVNFAENTAAKAAVDQMHGRLTNKEGVLPAEAPTVEPIAVATEKAADENPVEDKAVSEETVASPGAKDMAEKEAISGAGEQKTEEETAAAAKPTEEKKQDVERLYVVRAMSKAERMAMLKEAFNNSASEGKSKPQGINLYVKNLDDQVTDEKLREVFAKFGTVTSAKVMKDEVGVSKGFGFVCFAFPEEATKAVTAMHLKIFHNKPLYVGLAERRDSRLARLKARYRMSNVRPIGPNQMVMPPQQAQMPNFSGPPVPTGGPSVFYGPQIAAASGGRGQTGSFGMPPGGTDPMMWRQHPVRPFTQPGPMNSLATPSYPYQMGVPTGVHMRGQPAGRSQQRVRNEIPPLQMGAQQQSQHFKFTPQARNQQEFPQSAPQAGAGQLPVLQQQLIQQHVGEAASAAGGVTTHPLSAQSLSTVHPQMQKQMLGERLYPLVYKHQPDLAGKITGMMLEMDNTELLTLLDSEALLQAKVDEALGVLHRHQGGVAATLTNSAVAATTSVAAPHTGTAGGMLPAM